MTVPPEALADLFRQSAFISALVGGFAFTFLGVLRFSGLGGGDGECAVWLWCKTRKSQLPTHF